MEGMKVVWSEGRRKDGRNEGSMVWWEGRRNERSMVGRKERMKKVWWEGRRNKGSMLGREEEGWKE